ncbi:hypothetical protein NKH66_14280, partial [Mesorhizobium sp. M1023]
SKNIIASPHQKLDAGTAVLRSSWPPDTRLRSSPDGYPVLIVKDCPHSQLCSRAYEALTGTMMDDGAGG